MQDTFIQKVIIKHTSFAILTPISIGCDQFEDYFSSNINTIEINDEEKIQQLFNLLKKIEKIDSNYTEFVDTRAVLEIFNDNEKIEVICLGNLSIRMDGVVYKNNYKIRDFISQLFN